jgi:tetratricopeptide (TPR) repeat protein
MLAQVGQLRRAGRIAEAEQVCRRLLAAYPGAALALNAMALVLGERGAYAEAEPLARQAAAASPGEAVLHNNLGNLLYRRGDFAGAEAAFREAAALEPDYAVAHHNLGIVCQAQGRLDEALAAQRRAIEANPAYWQAHVRIGALLLERGDIDAAVTVLEKVAALQPQRPEIHFAHGNALVVANREDEALAAYERAIAAAPGFLPAHREYNDLAWSMGRDVCSRSSYRIARSRVGDQPDLLLAEAELHLRFAQAAAAEALLQQAKRVEPARADIADALGRTLALQGRIDEAQAEFERAIATEPDVLRYRQDLAAALLRSHQPAAARRVLERAMAKWPHDQSVLGCLAVAYRELGDAAFARLVNLEQCVREFDLPAPPGFADTASFNAALAEELERYHTRRVEPMDQTLRNGTQTAGALFKRNSRIVALLRESIRETVANYIRGLPFEAGHPFLSRKDETFHFSGSWSCRLRSSGFHTNHIHSGWISSAYYVDLPDAVREGNGGALKFGESQFYLGGEDRPLREVRPAVGKLVLFPSYYWHGTLPFVSDRARLTVAFDVLPGAPAAPSADRT